MSNSIFQNLPAWAQRIPFIREEVAKAEQSTEQARAASNRRIAELESSLSSGLPAFGKAEAETLAKLQAAEKVLLDCQHAYKKAKHARLNFATSTELQMDLIRIELRRDPSPLVEEFRREMLTLLETTRSTGHQRLEGIDYSLVEPKSITITNGLAIAARVKRLAEIARDEVPRLQLLPHADVAPAIEALRESIPECRDIWDDPKLAAKIAAGASQDFLNLRRVMKS